MEGLLGGSVYDFNLVSENAYGLSEHSASSLPAYTAPTATDNVSFVGATSHAVTLNWSAVSAMDPVTGYHV
eukprot:COSAG05_NODE_18706_length_304_cov_0.843902_1_plen_70_part_01